jgi:hypothetical protein
MSVDKLSPFLLDVLRYRLNELILCYNARVNSERLRSITITGILELLS